MTFSQCQAFKYFWRAYRSYLRLLLWSGWLGAASPGRTNRRNPLTDGMPACQNAQHGENELKPESEPEPAGVVGEPDDPGSAAKTDLRGQQRVQACVAQPEYQCKREQIAQHCQGLPPPHRMLTIAQPAASSGSRWRSLRRHPGGWRVRRTARRSSLAGS